MTADRPDELGNPGPHWRGDGTLTPRRELRVERGIEPARDVDSTFAGSSGQRFRVAGAEVAGFGRRLGSTAIDGVILVVLLAIAAGLAQIGLDPELDETRLGERIFGAAQLVLFGYLLPGNIFGWSPAKAMLGLRIVQADGSRPGFGVGLSRTLVSLPPIIFIGLFWSALDGRSQSWHDKAAGTYVVRRRRARPKRSRTDAPDVQWEFPDRPSD